MNAPAQAGLPAFPLNDSKLFRTQCYLDGNWINADSGKGAKAPSTASRSTSK